MVLGIKKQSKMSWERGDVIISDKKDVKINSNSYTKRTKLYKNGLWTDTKPLILSKDLSIRSI